MSDDVAYHTLEYLRAIRASQERVENDVKDMKFRLGQIEHSLAHHSGRFARMDDRLDRMENGSISWMLENLEFSSIT